jgi:hypothetical protein
MQISMSIDHTRVASMMGFNTQHKDLDVYQHISILAFLCATALGAAIGRLSGDVYKNRAPHNGALSFMAFDFLGLHTVGLNIEVLQHCNGIRVTSTTNGIGNSCLM